ncbi:MAG: DNA alkylation repair protein [Bacteroidota bacterium]
MSFIHDLQKGYSENAAPNNAVAMEKYMKNHFTFHGLKTEARRKIHKEALEQNKQEVKANARELALELYQKTEREYHYSAIEILMKKLKKAFRLEDITLIEHLLVTHSWWDSVDTISKYLLGGYLQQFPQERENILAQFSNSENMWLNRSVILFQLGYKKETDVALLFSVCEKHRHSKEFFIQKAIGWALREYAKTNPRAVKDFVENANLKPLSTREALKNL